MRLLNSLKGLVFYITSAFFWSLAFLWSATSQMYSDVDIYAMEIIFEDFGHYLNITFEYLRGLQISFL